MSLTDLFVTAIAWLLGGVVGLNVLAALVEGLLVLVSAYLDHTTPQENLYDRAATQRSTWGRRT